MLTIIKCKKCGWISPEMISDDLKKRGVPWYCDDCGERVESFIRFEPDEREIVYANNS